MTTKQEKLEALKVERDAVCQEVKNLEEEILSEKLIAAEIRCEALCKILRQADPEDVLLAFGVDKERAEKLMHLTYDRHAFSNREYIRHIDSWLIKFFSEENAYVPEGCIPALVFEDIGAICASKKI